MKDVQGRKKLKKFDKNSMTLNSNLNFSMTLHTKHI